MIEACVWMSESGVGGEPYKNGKMNEEEGEETESRDWERDREPTGIAVLFRTDKHCGEKCCRLMLRPMRPAGLSTILTS